MTIQDLWDKMLTLDLVPIFEAFKVVGMSFLILLVLVFAVMGCVAWYLYWSSQ